MELLICQSCGQIIRGRSKSCDGCGIVLSKHSPTVLASSLGGVSALAVPVKNDPLVLERTVNHVIYSRNGNGNGHGNGDGNGHESANTFLYNEQDLSNIIFPVSSEAPPDYGPEAEVEPQSEPESESYSQPDDIDPPPQAQWEPPPPTGNSMFGAAVAAAAIGTPMAAGAAHALASMGASAAQQAFGESGQAAAAVNEPSSAPDNGAFMAPRQDSFESKSSSSQDFAAPPQAETGSAFKPQSSAPDFFSTAPSAGAPPPASGGFDAAPPPANTFEPAPAAADFGAPPVSAAAAPDFTAAAPESSATAPPSAGNFAPAPSVEPVKETSPAESFNPAPTSAQASSRPGLMDFFSSTSAANTPAPEASSSARENTDSNRSFESSSSPSSSFSGSQASIIQNAIQAAAALNAGDNQSGTVVADFRQGSGASSSNNDENDDAKPTKKAKGSSKKLRPKPDEDGDEAPISGKTSSKTKVARSSAGKTSSSKLDKADSKADGKKGSKSGRKSSSESKSDDKKIELLGFSLPLKVLKVSGFLVLIVAFPLMVLIANISSLLGPLLNGGVVAGAGGGGQAMTSAAPTGLSGQWDLAYQNPNQSIGRGGMSITQNGSKIEGFGVDKARFQINGVVSGSKVQFSKQYVQDNQPIGKPIVYQGNIDYAADNPPPGQPYAHISGVWQLTKREGYSWRAQIVSMQGKWEAALTKRGPGSGTIATGPSMGSGGQAGQPDMGAPKDPKKAQSFFMNVAIGIISIGVVIAMVSLKFFGPSGLLNIWAKKEYIPSQFKAQHFKMVGEMGKPLRIGGVPLGVREEWGIHQFWRPRVLNLPPELREANPHTLILGAGAKGKSRLMASMIANDIEGGDRGVVVVDSDGALVDLIMHWIAAHPKGKQIAKRVIVIDPTHDGETICYNPLEYPDDGDLQNAASSIVFGFKAIYTEPPGSQSQWNQQTANILRNSAVLLMANGKSLTDLPVLLSDNDFRDIMLEKVERMKHEKSEYTTLIDAWSNYKRLARTDQWINWIEPILNRVQPMLGDPRIRPILTQSKSDLNLQSIIKNKKILFVKIPQGQLDQNGNLLGSLMVTGVKQAALSLSVKGGAKKRPCALYLDEFDTFIEKETFDAITSETRKFQLGFCGASKSLQTLPEDYRNQLIINVGVMAVFALAKKDGDMLGPQMFRVDGRKVKHQTIQNVFNKVNSSPQFELISDEEKLNIDRVVGQEERTFFCYRVGTVAGVFHMKSPEFKDVDEKDINHDLIEQMYENRWVDSDDEDDEEDDED